MADRSDFQQQLNAMQNPVLWANALHFIAAQVADKSHIKLLVMAGLSVGELSCREVYAA
jgi:hypothetical protein